MELLGPANHTGLGRVPAGPGAGVTVGVIDTGVNQGQTQLQLPEFTSGMSTGRTLSNLGSHVWSNDSPWGQCNHGTRMAGLIGAPRDGRNVVGIAWKANLTTVRTHESVVIGSDNASDIVRGIRKVVNAGAWPGPPKIVTLAFGNPIVLGAMHYIADQIRETYYSNPNVLFLGAAGTDFCLFGLSFPGYLSEVTTIAGVATDRRTPSSGSCAGDAVDLAAVVGNGNIETTGRTTGEVVGLGGSSARPRPSLASLRSSGRAIRPGTATRCAHGLRLRASAIATPRSDTACPTRTRPWAA